MGGWFRGYTGSLLAAACRVACPLTDLTGNFAQPTGTFTPELPASRSPFSSSGITTVATERFHRGDFHPLEGQLASLHGLFHPLQHAGLSRRSPGCRQYIHNDAPDWWGASAAVGSRGEGRQSGRPPVRIGGSAASARTRHHSLGGNMLLPARLTSPWVPAESRRGLMNPIILS